METADQFLDPLIKQAEVDINDFILPTLSTLAGAGMGGYLGSMERPGESRAERKKRLLKNVLIGSLGGATVGTLGQLGIASAKSALPDKDLTKGEVTMKALTGASDVLGHPATLAAGGAVGGGILGNRVQKSFQNSELRSRYADKNLTPENVRDMYRGLEGSTRADKFKKLLADLGNPDTNPLRKGGPLSGYVPKGMTQTITKPEQLQELFSSWRSAGSHGRRLGRSTGAILGGLAAGAIPAISTYVDHRNQSLYE